MRATSWRPDGIWGTVLLPVKRGAVDHGALTETVDILCASPLAGLYTNGTACEFHNQTEAEFDALAELVASRARAAGKPFQIGVSDTNARRSRERLARIGALSPDGVQFIVPDWWPPAPDEQKRFVAGMQAAAGDLPLVLYQPPHAKTQLSLAEIAALRAEAPGLVGIKCLGGDAAWYAERRRLLPSFSVFVGGGSVAFGRPLGADGSYSNLACLTPHGAVRHWHMIESNPDMANEIEARFMAFLKTYLLPLGQGRRTLSNSALDKLMAAAGGWGPVGPDLLWPYSGANAEDVTAVAQAARAALPELFEA
ncbi:MULTISPECIES: dihydrodipicolinate synthase family protein [unclassified Roseitalea]|uniref:dihydrodipicolinate synthase family protein n=1 Tax=unclassified Roseitalea TaxID=2639107 RepID=UPI00273FF4CE|nr:MULTISPECIES: dihydrodipicolinate synthase family protein [unclassified Roseitalea]